MDYFYEQLIVIKKPALYTITRFISFAFILIAIFFILSFNLSSIIIGLIFGLIGASLFFLKQKIYTEYEYIITNGSIDIDRIVEQNKRKKIIEFDIKNVELMAEENSDEVKNFSNKPQKKLDCVIRDNHMKVYIAYITMGGDRCTIRFTPDEKFLDICFKFNPRAVKR